MSIDWEGHADDTLPAFDVLLDENSGLVDTELLDGCTLEFEKGSLVIHLKLKDEAARQRFEKALQDGSIKVLIGNLLRKSGIAMGELKFKYTQSADMVSIAIADKSKSPGLSQFYFVVDC